MLRPGFPLLADKKALDLIVRQEYRSRALRFASYKLVHLKGEVILAETQGAVKQVNSTICFDNLVDVTTFAIGKSVESGLKMNCRAYTANS